MTVQDLSQLVAVAPEPLNANDLPDPTFNAHSPHSHNDPWLRKIIRVLVPIQKYSSMGFASFLGLHVTSVAIIPGLGAPLPESQQIFEMGRALYQWAPVEKFIFISLGIHVVSGISLRIARTVLGTRRKKRNSFEPIKSPEDDDIGLGGITSLLGLGYRRSWISTQFPGLSPLSFSGYVLMPLLAYHYYKFRLRPLQVDGDSSLVNLHYVAYVLKGSVWGHIGNWVNTLLLAGLVWVTMYHWVTGVMRYQRWFSARSRWWGYVVINSVRELGMVSITRLRMLKLDTDYVGRHFMAYVQ